MRIEDLEVLLRRWERERGLCGSVLLTRDGTPLLEGCYGIADRGCGAPVTPRTRFGLASVTKLFTAVAVADLVEQGALRYEDRVVDLLPADRRPATLLPQVSVHHLLTHTSGIADYFEEEAEHPAHQEDYGALWWQVPCSRMQRPADFLPLFSELAPYRPPGGRHQYCNAGYILLGLVVEQVAGRPFAEQVEQRVLRPAGMHDSGFLRTDEAHPDVAVGYLPRPHPGAPWRNNVHQIPVVGGPDGGAFATARDLDRFLTALDDGVLVPGQRDVVLARHCDAGDGFTRGYGVLHAPDGRWGHGGGDPGVDVRVHRDPGRRTNLVVLCSGEELAGAVRDAVLENAPG